MSDKPLINFNTFVSQYISKLNELCCNIGSIKTTVPQAYYDTRYTKTITDPQTLGSVILKTPKAYINEVPSNIVEKQLSNYLGAQGVKTKVNTTQIDATTGDIIKEGTLITYKRYLQMITYLAAFTYTHCKYIQSSFDEYVVESDKQAKVLVYDAESNDYPNIDFTSPDSYKTYQTETENISEAIRIIFNSLLQKTTRLEVVSFDIDKKEAEIEKGYTAFTEDASQAETSGDHTTKYSPTPTQPTDGRTIFIPKSGIYEIYLCGAGGAGGEFIFGNSEGGGGGSGAFLQVKTYLISGLYKVHIGQKSSTNRDYGKTVHYDSNDTYLSDSNGVIYYKATGGYSGRACAPWEELDPGVGRCNNHGEGGFAYINPDITTQIVKCLNGKAGGNGGNCLPGTGGASVEPYHGYGAGAVSSHDTETHVTTYGTDGWAKVVFVG